jgi:transposase
MMKRFVRGADRHQTTLLPELIGLRRATLDVDVFVDALERRDLGFDGVDPAATSVADQRWIMPTRRRSSRYSRR